MALEMPIGSMPTKAGQAVRDASSLMVPKEPKINPPPLPPGPPPAHLRKRKKPSSPRDTTAEATTTTASTTTTATLNIAAASAATTMTTDDGGESTADEEEEEKEVPVSTFEIALSSAIAGAGILAAAVTAPTPSPSPVDDSASAAAAAAAISVTSTENKAGSRGGGAGAAGFFFLSNKEKLRRRNEERQRQREIQAAAEAEHKQIQEKHELAEALRKEAAAKAEEAAEKAAEAAALMAAVADRAVKTADEQPGALAPGSVPDMFLSKEQREARRVAAKAQRDKQAAEEATRQLKEQVRQANELASQFREDLGVGGRDAMATLQRAAAEAAALASGDGQDCGMASGTVNLATLGRPTPFPTAEQTHVNSLPAAGASDAGAICTPPAISLLPFPLRVAHTRAPAFTNSAEPRMQTPVADPTFGHVLSTVSAASVNSSSILLSPQSSATAAANCTRRKAATLASTEIMSPELVGLDVAPSTPPFEPPEALCGSERAHDLYRAHYRTSAVAPLDDLRAAAWPSKHQPQFCRHLAGNRDSAVSLKVWLAEWRARMEANRRRSDAGKQKKGGKRASRRSSLAAEAAAGRAAGVEEMGAGDSGDEYSVSEEEEEEEEDDASSSLNNVMLLRGEVGAGKTAAVYACAAELGYKVLEINTSDRRSGKCLVSMLKEATESHQVSSTNDMGASCCHPTRLHWCTESS
eukprot:UC1_evm1s1218